MRLGLIGSTGHWQTYAPALERVPGLTLVAVAAAGPEETTGAFDHAPGLTAGHAPLRRRRGRCSTTERLDVVQVCRRVRPDPGLGAHSAWNAGCRSWRRSRWRWTCPRWKGSSRPRGSRRRPSSRCTRCGACRSWRRCGRRSAPATIGDPLMSFSQKTYKWGKTRPDSYRSRKTFPGLAPWVGIHAFDWLHWILGDVFTEVRGARGRRRSPDFPACASQAAFVLTMSNGGVASVTLDYLRPEAAPTHGDERLRIAGTRGRHRDRAGRAEGDAHRRRPAAPDPAAEPADGHLHAVRPLAPRRGAAPAHAARGLPDHRDRHQGAAGRRHRAGRLARAIRPTARPESRRRQDSARDPAGVASDPAATSRCAANGVGGSTRRSRNGREACDDRAGNRRGTPRG